MTPLCRNGRHPKPAPGTKCPSCSYEWHRARRIAQTGGRDGWADPVADAVRAQRLQAWQDGVDDAIAALRQAEGFDGRSRTWTTLGECLLSEPPRAAPRPRGRMVVTCERCKYPRFYGSPCAGCAAGLERRMAS